MLFLLACETPGSHDSAVGDEILWRAGGTVDGEELPDLPGGYWLNDAESGIATFRIRSYSDACEADTAWYRGLEAGLAGISTYDALEELEAEVHRSTYADETAGIDLRILYGEEELYAHHALPGGSLDWGEAEAVAWRLTRHAGTWDAWFYEQGTSRDGDAYPSVYTEELTWLDLDATLDGQDTIFVDGALPSCRAAWDAEVSYDSALREWEARWGYDC